MPKRRIIVASVLLAPFALAAIFLFHHAQLPAVSPSQVLTWDCELPVQKPDAITFTCGDGNMYVEHIDWSRWDSKKASGSGIYTVNNCDPDCVDGTFIHVPVNITLSHLTEWKKKFYLRALVILSKDGKNLPMMSTSSYEWDVMEFAEMMGENK